jgi:diamine N-acetyltransferase
MMIGRGLFLLGPNLILAGAGNSGDTILNSTGRRGISSIKGDLCLNSALRANEVIRIIEPMAKERFIHFTVRQAGADDAEAISRIGGMTFASAYGAIVRPEDMAGYVQNMFEPSRIATEIGQGDAHYFIGETSGGVVGYAKTACTLPPETMPRSHLIELVRLYLDDRHYGQGIGEALLKLAAEQAATAGFTGMWLRVWQKNTGAIRFYMRHGFHSVGSEPYLIGETANPVEVMLAGIGEGGRLMTFQQTGTTV